MLHSLTRTYMYMWLGLCMCVLTCTSHLLSFAYPFLFVWIFLFKNKNKNNKSKQKHSIASIRSSFNALSLHADLTTIHMHIQTYICIVHIHMYRSICYFYSALLPFFLFDRLSFGGSKNKFNTFLLLLLLLLFFDELQATRSSRAKSLLIVSKLTCVVFVVIGICSTLQFKSCFVVVCCYFWVF